MKIQSVKKLEKQADHYSETHPVVMSQEWQDHYNLIHDQFLEARKALDLIQESCLAKWGSFEKCNCMEHPDYVKVQSILRPIAKRLKDMDYELAGLQRLVYEKELGSLLRMRRAKIEYTS